MESPDNNEQPSVFGHTIATDGKEMVLLFGGAIGKSNQYTVTNRTYSFDKINGKWKEILCSGEIPSPRAAHASVIISNVLIIFGGSRDKNLTDDKLYMCSIKQDSNEGVWKIIPVIGQTPGSRYGHTMVNYYANNLIIYGGSNQKDVLDDAWILDLTQEKKSWVNLNLTIKSKIPVGRVYHAASVCPEGVAKGMMVMSGGRSNSKSPLNDCWGLRKHRNGEWDWIETPNSDHASIPGFYMHNSIFLKNHLIIVGGRKSDVKEALPMLVFDTEKGKWKQKPSITRFRHGSWLSDTKIFVYGGFEQKSTVTPLNSFVILDLTKIFQSDEDILPKKIAANFTPTKNEQAIIPPKTPKLQKSFEEKKSVSLFPTTTLLSSKKEKVKSEEETKNEFLLNLKQKSIPFIKVSELQIFRNEDLGSGGFGRVYKGTFLKAPVAIKEYHTFNIFHEDQTLCESILSEISNAISLNFPKFNKCYGVSLNDQGFVCSVHELAASSLAKLLKETKGNMDRTTKDFITEQLLQIMLQLSERKVVHRDLKPANFLITQSNEIQICDFGTIRKIKNDQDETWSKNETFTISYAPPEFFSEEKEIGLYSDIWSLGIIIFEIYYGKRFWGNVSTDEIMLKIKKKNIPKAEKKNDIPKEITQIINGALIYDGKKRMKILEIIEMFEKMIG